MPSRTRAEVALRVHEKLDRMADGMSYAAAGPTHTEGDYTFPIDSALMDCGLENITEADTFAKIRAVERGTEYYTLQRLIALYTARANAQQGAGASGMHLAISWEDALPNLRFHARTVKEEYIDALAAIGRSLSTDPAGSQSMSGPVLIDDDLDATKALVSPEMDVGLPWFGEGYHEMDT